MNKLFDEFEWDEEETDCTVKVGEWVGRQPVHWHGGKIYKFML